MQPVPLVHEGRALAGELYAPASAVPLPGVMVMHSGLGLSDQFRVIARQLAAQGYAALACDMFGGDMGSDPARAGVHFAALVGDRKQLRDRVLAWFETFANLPQVDAQRIAAIGYCFGGLCVLELARSGADLKLVSSFHGLLTTHAPAKPGAISAKVLAWCGGRDPYAPEADIKAFRAEMTQAGTDARTVVFPNAEHGFTDPDAAMLGRAGIAYDEAAHAESWADTLAALRLI